MALQLSWLKRLYDKNFHPWKIIPKHIFSTISKTNIFYPNLSFNDKCFQNILPVFYKNIINYWCEISASPPITASSILSEKVFNNNFLKIGRKVIECNFLNDNDMLVVADLFNEEGNITPWDCFKELHDIEKKN